MRPGAHEVPLLNVFSCVVLRLPVVPDLINNRLQVLFLHNEIGQIPDKIAELLIWKPRNVVFDGSQKEVLKAPVHCIFKFVSEMRKDQV